MSRRSTLVLQLRHLSIVSCLSVMKRQPTEPQTHLIKPFSGDRV
jgi:hypothetical protein